MIGERVRVAREASGYTQEELGQMVGLSQGQVSDLEGGRVFDPSADTLRDIAKALSYPITFFDRGRPLPDMPEGHSRKLKRGTARVSGQMRAQVRQAIELVVRAEAAALRLPAVALEPVRELGDLEDVEAVAEATRIVMGVGSRDPIPNMTRAAERAGIVVVRLSTDMEDHDGFSCWPDFGLDGRPILAISPRSGDRDRFTIAHEIGHLMLHTRRKVDPDRAEKEAHRFAGALLLPRAAAKRAIRPPVTLSVLKGVKVNYGISIAAGAQRAKDLQMIDQAHFVSLRRQMSARRWNKNEPVEVATERPLLMPRIIDTLAGEGGRAEQRDRIGLPDFTIRGLAV